MSSSLPESSARSSRAAICRSGRSLVGDSRQRGHEAVSERTHAPLEEVREVAANCMRLLIALHVAGVLFSSVAHGENPVRGMITGTKRSA